MATLSYKASKKMEDMLSIVSNDTEDIVLEIVFDVDGFRKFLGHGFDIDVEEITFHNSGLFSKKEWKEERISVHNVCADGFLFGVRGLKVREYLGMEFHFKYLGQVSSASGGYGISFSYLNSYISFPGDSQEMKLSEKQQDTLLFRSRGIHIDQLVFPLVKVQWGNDILVVLPEELKEIKEMGVSLIEGEELNE